jgi:HEAT repeat protein
VSDTGPGAEFLSGKMSGPNPNLRAHWPTRCIRMAKRDLVAGVVCASVGAILAGVVFTNTACHRVGGDAAGVRSREGCVPGQQVSWDLAFDVELSQPSQASPIRTSVSGTWVMVVSAARAGECDVRCELRNPKVSGGGVAGVSTEESEALGGRLSRPFWVTYRDDGAALTVHFHKEVDPSALNLLQMIVTEMQLVRPARSQPHWTTVERDGAGSYVAAYQNLSPDSMSGAVVKTKLKYLESSGVTGSSGSVNVPVSIVKSERRFDLGAGGIITSLTGAEHLRIAIPLGKSDGALEVRTNVRFFSVRTESVPDLVNSLDRVRATIQSGPILTHQSDPAEAQVRADRRLLDGYTTDALLETGGQGTAGTTATLDRLPALFRQRPESVARATAMVREGHNAGRIVHALGTAGTQAAQEALTRISHDTSLPVRVRVESLAALLQLRHPSAAAMRAPRDLIDDVNPAIRNVAALSLGGLARAGRETERDEALATDRLLANHYSKASDAQERMDILSAIGNSAGASLLPTIESALRESPLVRAAAARALRLFPASDSDFLLVDVMAKDPDPSVRSAAIFAAKFRPLTEAVLTALIKSAKHDPVDRVRADAVTLLGQRERESPRIPEALAQVAASEPKASIRKLARRDEQPSARGPR